MRKASDMPLKKLLIKSIGMPSKSPVIIDVLLQPLPALKGPDCKEKGKKNALTVEFALGLISDGLRGSYLSAFCFCGRRRCTKAYEKRCPQNVYTIKTISQQKL